MNGLEFKKMCDSKGVTYPTSDKARKKIEARLRAEEKILNLCIPDPKCNEGLDHSRN